MIRPDSQNGRILAALASGRWQTTRTIHAKAGTCRLNSRMAELRRHGYRIEHERVPGVADGPRAHRYRLVGTPGGQPIIDLAHDLAARAAAVDAIEIPRDPEHRYRIYAATEDGVLVGPVATCPDEESVGVAICTLGREGQWGRSCIGILDSGATENGTPPTGAWLVNPFEVL